MMGLPHTHPYEHKTFQFIFKVLEKFQKKKISWCINHQDNLWVNIETLEIQDGGCGSCGSSYKSIFINGTARFGKSRKRFYYDLSVSQYSVHICDDGEPEGKPDYILLQFWATDPKNLCPEYYLNYRELVSQYQLLINTEEKTRNILRKSLGRFFDESLFNIISGKVEESEN